MRANLARVKTYLLTVRLIIYESFTSFLRNGGLDRSAALTFYTFLSLIPLLLVEVFVVAQLIHSSDRALELLKTMTSNFIPAYGQFIMDEVGRLSVGKSWGLIGIVLLIWSATPLASGIRNALRAIFRPEKPLPFLKGLVFDVMAVVVTLAVMGTSLFLKVAYTAGTSLLSPGVKSAAHIVYGALLFFGLPMLLILFYRFFIPVRIKWRYIIGGSIVTAVLLSIVGPFFTFVLKYNPNLGLAFGSLKAMFLLLLWVYYSFAMVFLGTEIMANMARHEALIISRLFINTGFKPVAKRLLSKLVSDFGPGETIFKEGDVGTHMYYVVEGAVQLTKEGKQFRVMKTGEYFGEMAMLLDTVRTMTASAIESGAQVVSISRENLDTVLRENPRIILSVLKEMASRLKSTDESVIS